MALGVEAWTDTRFLGAK
jgi:hypothetical protein